jgi:hypothetical protein
LRGSPGGYSQFSRFPSLDEIGIRFRHGIDKRAMRAYIRRVHPKLHDKLAELPALSELAVFWRQYRTKDMNMKGLTAEDLEQFWKAGIPLRITKTFLLA